MKKHLSLKGVTTHRVLPNLELIAKMLPRHLTNLFFATIPFPAIDSWPGPETFTLSSVTSFLRFLRLFAPIPFSEFVTLSAP